jgi:hypothetical protein
MQDNTFSKDINLVQYWLHAYTNPKHCEQKLRRGIVVNIVYHAKQNDSEQLEKM